MPDNNVTIPAADANRQFSRLLREAASGKVVTITSHGRPVAVLSPVDHDGDAKTLRRAQALADLKAHWAQRAKDVTEASAKVRWTRAELYDD